MWARVRVGVIVAGAALAAWVPWRKAAPTRAVAFEVWPAEKMKFIDQAAMTVSPDGRWMVFPANGDDGVQHFYLRSLDGVELRVLPGAEIKERHRPRPGPTTVAGWSLPWVEQLKKIDIRGGPPQNIADFPNIASPERAGTRRA